MARMEATARPLRIGHLYPDLMKIYGDLGNVIALRNRAAWRNIPVEVVELGEGSWDAREVDIFFIGGGQDLDQSRMYLDLLGKRSQLVSAVTSGAAILAVCGGYQLLGHAYSDAHGKVLEGIGLIDGTTTAGEGRWIGNVVVEAGEALGLGPVPLAGFENHGGNTWLGSGVAPLGRVLVGGGNNGVDGTEGAVQGNVIGTYLHGSFLPRNPRVADWLLAAGLRHRDKAWIGPLADLDDTVELAAQRSAVAIAMAEKGRKAVARA